MLFHALKVVSNMSGRNLRKVIVSSLALSPSLMAVASMFRYIYMRDLVDC